MKVGMTRNERCPTGSDLIISQAFEHLGEDGLSLPRVVEVIHVLLKLVQGVSHAVLDVVLELAIAHVALLVKIDNLRDFGSSGLLDAALVRFVWARGMPVIHVDLG